MEATLEPIIAQTISRRRGRKKRRELEPMPTLKELERAHIARVLELTGGDQAHASEVLGIDRRTIYRMLDGYALEAENAREQGPIK
jgi:DNA-binding NtrC family response regulator